MSRSPSDDLRLEPLRAPTVSDLAYERLKEAIISGHFRPGEKLVESSLASRLDVSRTPLRQALAFLEREGLLEREARGSLIVPAFSTQEIEELYEVRTALEGLAAYKAAENVAEGSLSAAELKSIEEMLTLLEQQIAGPVETLSESRPYTTGFHLLVHSLSKHRRCVQILEDVMSSMNRYRAFAPPERNIAGLVEHQRILQAISDGHPVLAAAEMRAHTADSGILYKKIIAKLLSAQTST